MKKIGALLKLTRLPLVFTAIADSAAGYLITLPAGTAPRPVVLALLAGASACLYACGMVFNDVADALRDRVLHPERPIPSGQVTARAARGFGMALMFAGALFALLINSVAGQVVLLVFVLIMAYNFAAKARAVPGAVTMGLVRAANFTLGVVAVVPRGAGLALPAWEGAGYVHALVLGAYVFFLTLMSTLEDADVRRGPFLTCATAMALVPLGALLLARSLAAIVLASLLAVALFANALGTPSRATVMRNVRWGVLAIIALDASFVMARVGWCEGLAVLALALPALVLLPLFRRL